MLFRDEAETCRRQAAAYKGRPERPFLLQVARAFDELAVLDTAPTPSGASAPPKVVGKSVPARRRS